MLIHVKIGVGAPSQEALFGEADDISDSDDDMDALVNQLAGGSQDERDRDDNYMRVRDVKFASGTKNINFGFYPYTNVC